MVQPALEGPKWKLGGWGYGGGLPARNDKGVGALWPCRTSEPLVVSGFPNRLADWLGMAKPNTLTDESCHRFDGMWLGM